MLNIQILIYKATLALLMISLPGTTPTQQQDGINQAVAYIQEAQTELNNQSIAINASSAPVTPQATTTAPAIGAPTQIVETPIVASGTCTLSIQRNGDDIFISYQANNKPVENSDNTGLIYYQNNSTTAWATDAVARVNGMSNKQFTPDQRYFGDKLKEGVKNATNFKLVYPDGTTCYSNP